MIINAAQIYEKLTDDNNWEPVEFINHRREMLRFEKVAVIDYNGDTYAYLYEIDDEDEHINDFPAVVRFEKNDLDEYILDFVTDKNLIEDIAYEVMTLRRSEDPDEVEILYDENAEYDEDPDGEYFDDEELNEEYDYEDEFDDEE
ncbi:MAG: hypothetical protein E7626_00660 [Ruminococcaceae bacterium]|nr:hypothetical protein [Oscillospiraceae bacterium]